MYSVSYDGTNKKVLWQELLRHEFAAALKDAPVVIVPTGSVEQHGPHCPMDVDLVGPFYMAALASADGDSVGHGGEWETSLQLYLRPHLIDASRMVADVFPNPYSANLQHFAQYAERRRDTAKVTGVMGDPFAATAEKGERL